MHTDATFVVLAVDIIAHSFFAAEYTEVRSAGLTEPIRLEVDEKCREGYIAQALDDLHHPFEEASVDG